MSISREDQLAKLSFHFPCYAIFLTSGGWLVSFGQLGPNLVSLAATVDRRRCSYTRVFRHRTVIKSLDLNFFATMYQKLFWVIAILIKDIYHNNHHNNDDGDHADIDMECGLAGAICQMTSGVRLSDVACHDQCTNLFIGFHLRKTCHDQYAPISLVLIGFHSKTTSNAPIMGRLIDPPFLSPFSQVNRFVKTSCWVN